MNDRETNIDTFCGCLRIQQRYGDGDKSATLQARRVTTSDRGEHVQIEMNISSHGKRTTSQHFSMSLDPNETAILINALTRLHPP